MKFFVSLFLSLLSVFVLSNACTFALDIDLDAGEQIFSQNCTACHAGGNNTVNPDKTLKFDALDLYGKSDIEAIIAQIKKGAGPMPAFAERLSEEEISNVANFVLNQAKNNSW